MPRFSWKRPLRHRPGCTRPGRASTHAMKARPGARAARRQRCVRKVLATQPPDWGEPAPRPHVCFRLATTRGAGHDYSAFAQSEADCGLLRRPAPSSRRGMGPSCPALIWTCLYYSAFPSIAPHQVLAKRVYHAQTQSADRVILPSFCATGQGQTFAHQRADGLDDDAQVHVFDRSTSQHVKDCTSAGTLLSVSRCGTRVAQTHRCIARLLRPRQTVSKSPSTVTKLLGVPG